MRRPLFVSFSLLAAAACTSGDTARIADSAAASTAAKPVTCAGDNAGLTLPAGFCATIFGDSIGRARHVVVASNGDVYTTIEGGQKSDAGAGPAAFVAMRDTNHDGKADIIQRIAGKGNTGIGLANGYLYVDEGTRIVRHARADTALVPTTATEVIVDNLPFTGHRARNFVIAPDGALYLNVGSASNSCQQTDRKVESPGVDPCTELATRAGTWKFDAGTLNQHFSAGARFATGIRNGMGLTVGPGNVLFQTQHGRDQLHDNWPKVFPTTEYQAANPGEEFIQVNQNDDFGWPYCYYAMDKKTLVNAPEYGGDGTKTDRCTTKKEPIAAYPGHWAPMSLMFYTGAAFPEHYRNGAFIAFHGSWNRAPQPQEGYRVVFQPMSGATASAAYETFANGFAGVPDAQLQPGTAQHRPVGLATAPDGALIITDDAGGRVYRVTYGRLPTRAATQ